MLKTITNTESTRNAQTGEVVAVGNSPIKSVDANEEGQSDNRYRKRNLALLETAKIKKNQPALSVLRLPRSILNSTRKNNKAISWYISTFFKDIATGCNGNRKPSGQASVLKLTVAILPRNPNKIDKRVVTVNFVLLFISGYKISEKQLSIIQMKPK